MAATAATAATWCSSRSRTCAISGRSAAGRVSPRAGVATAKEALGEVKAFKDELGRIRKDLKETWKATDGSKLDKAKADLDVVVKGVEKLADSKVVAAVERGVEVYETVTDPLGKLKEKVRDIQLASGVKLDDRLKKLESALDDFSADLNPGGQLVASSVVEDDQRKTIGG